MGTIITTNFEAINMTKEEILIEALNKRCQYESSKEMDYDTHLAIMDAMDDYLKQEMKELTLLTFSDLFCSICKNKLTNFELERNVCTNCGNSPSPLASIRTNLKQKSKVNSIGNAYLVLMRWDYAPYRAIVFAKTERGARGKAKRKFPFYEIIGVKYIKHYL